MSSIKGIATVLLYYDIVPSFSTIGLHLLQRFTKRWRSGLIPISLHILSEKLQQCWNSLSMSSLQFFNSLKTFQSFNHLVCCVYVLVAFLQFGHQWLDRFQRDEEDGQRQNVLKCSLMVAPSLRLMQCHIFHCSLRLHRCMLVHGSFKY